MNSVSSAAATRHLEPYPMYDSGIVPRYRPSTRPRSGTSVAAFTPPSARYVSVSSKHLPSFVFCYF